MPRTTGFPALCIPKPCTAALCLALLCIALLSAVAAAQVPATGTAPRLEGHSLHGQAFDEGARQSAVLLEGMGDVTFPITTAAPEAQAFFEQGLGQVHGFWFFEAERSFRQAAALDPACAMAYWGMALANLDLEKNQGRARGFAAEALRRREQASERERRWIDAWGAFYELDAKELPAPRPANDAAAWQGKRSEKERRRDLVRKLEEIVRAEPQDLEAKALLAVLIWWNTDHGLPISSHQPIDLLLDAVFAGKPMHTAHHFRIHLWDGEKPELALRSAVLSGPSAPGIAHMWHMGGHIFDGLMRPREAAWLQEASARVDHAAMRRDRVMPFLIHNYGHNQEWLSRSLMQLGRRSEALRIATNLVELPRHPRWNDPQQPRTIAAFGELRILDAVERFEDWDALARLAESGHLRCHAGERADRARAQGLLGRAAAQRADRSEAESARAALLALLEEERTARFAKAATAETRALEEKADEEKVHDAMKKALRDNAEPQREIERELALLDAWIAWSAGEKELARKHYERAAPRSVWRKVDFLRAIGDFEPALAALDEALAKARGDATLLARRVRVLSDLGRTAEIGAAFDALSLAAGAADLEAPLFASLRDVATSLGKPEDWRQPADWPPDFERPRELSELGPFAWQPVRAEPARFWNENGEEFSLEEWSGRPVLVVFYLGFSCLHCVEQLQALRPLASRFRAAGIEIAAIGTDEVFELKEELKALGAKDRFDFPLFADPDRAAFRAFRAYDDFELEPLHGTFLLDAQGRIRWQDVGPDPFLALEPLLAEAQRLLALDLGEGEHASPRSGVLQR